MKFRAESDLAGEIIDWFGKDVKFSNETGGMIDVNVSVNEHAFVFWALQYGQYVEVLEPAGVREQVKDAVVEMAGKYE